jgi:hypothetical protein
VTPAPDATSSDGAVSMPPRFGLPFAHGATEFRDISVQNRSVVQNRTFLYSAKTHPVLYRAVGGPPKPGLTLQSEGPRCPQRRPPRPKPGDETRQYKKRAREGPRPSRTGGPRGARPSRVEPLFVYGRYSPAGVPPWAGGGSVPLERASRPSVICWIERASASPETLRDSGSAVTGRDYQTLQLQIRRPRNVSSVPRCRQCRRPITGAEAAIAQRSGSEARGDRRKRANRRAGRKKLSRRPLALQRLPNDVAGSAATSAHLPPTLTNPQRPLLRRNLPAANSCHPSAATTRIRRK